MTTTPAPELIATSTWNIDPVHSTAQFKVKHLMISNVKGEFTAITGKLEFNSADVTKSRVEASIDAKTINTREPQRDTHLKSADFFDVEKYPALTFKSTRIVKKVADELDVEGDLSMHGVTRKVTFDVEWAGAPVKDLWGGTRMGMSATTRINRKDFGMAFNSVLDSGGIAIGEEVTITLDVQFVKA